jgi:hypothetical protein
MFIVEFCNLFNFIFALYALQNDPAILEGCGTLVFVDYSFSEESIHMLKIQI